MVRTGGANNAENDVDAESLPNDAGAKAPELGRVGKIGIAAFLRAGALLRR